MARRRATLDELRVAVDAEKTDKMQENVLPYMLAYSRRRMAGGGDKAPSLAAYHHEVAESIEVVDRTRHRWRKTVWNSNLQLDFNVRVFECFDTSSSAGHRELDASNRSVQKSAESTSI